MIAYLQKKSLNGGMGAEKSVCMPKVQYNTSHVYDRWTGTERKAKVSFFGFFLVVVLFHSPVICIIPHSTVT